VHAGAPFPAAPIPLGNLALGGNGSFVALVFGASAAACEDALRAVAQHGGSILPLVAAGSCGAVSLPSQAGGRRLFFTARTHGGGDVSQAE
jgi:hypothetical protein